MRKETKLYGRTTINFVKVKINECNGNKLCWINDKIRSLIGRENSFFKKGIAERINCNVLLEILLLLSNAISSE